ncbi:hypothetical protein ACULV4_002095 [Cronobacter dublinensis]
MLKTIFCGLFGCMLSLCANPVYATSQPVAVITRQGQEMDGTLVIFFKQSIVDLGPAGDQIPPQGWYVGIAGPMGYSSSHVNELNWIPGNYKTMADGKKPLLS